MGFAELESSLRQSCGGPPVNWRKPQLRRGLQLGRLQWKAGKCRKSSLDGDGAFCFDASL